MVTAWPDHTPTTLQCVRTAVVVCKAVKWEENRMGEKAECRATMPSPPETLSGRAGTGGADAESSKHEEEEEINTINFTKLTRVSELD